jgi:hypothetical protein
LRYYKSENFEESHPLDSELWIQNSHYLIELMKSLKKDSKNYNEIRNCLILLLNLCFDIEKPDHLYEKGKSSTTLTNSEKDLFLGLLRTELNNFH